MSFCLIFSSSASSNLQKQKETVETAELQEQVIEYKVNQKEKNCIIDALYHEARGEGTKGIKAVASVIQNRTKHPDYPATYCGVIKQRNQFSYTLLNKPSGKRLERSIDDSEREVYTYISDIAQNMLRGQFKPSLPSSVLWYTSSTVKNHWTSKKQVVAKVGKHKFYADKA